MRAARVLVAFLLMVAASTGYAQTDPGQTTPQLDPGQGGGSSTSGDSSGEAPKVDHAKVGNALRWLGTLGNYPGESVWRTVLEGFNYEELLAVQMRVVEFKGKQDWQVPAGLWADAGKREGSKPQQPQNNPALEPTEAPQVTGSAGPQVTPAPGANPPPGPPATNPHGSMGDGPGGGGSTGGSGSQGGGSSGEGAGPPEGYSGAGRQLGDFGGQLSGLAKEAEDLFGPPKTEEDMPEIGERPPARGAAATRKDGGRGIMGAPMNRTAVAGPLAARLPESARFAADPARKPGEGPVSGAATVGLADGQTGAGRSPPGGAPYGSQAPYGYPMGTARPAGAVGQKKPESPFPKTLGLSEQDLKDLEDLKSLLDGGVSGEKDGAKLAAGKLDSMVQKGGPAGNALAELRRRIRTVLGRKDRRPTAAEGREIIALAAKLGLTREQTRRLVESIRRTMPRAPEPPAPEEGLWERFLRWLRSVLAWLISLAR